MDASAAATSRVVITRPADEARPWQAALQQRGLAVKEIRIGDQKCYTVRAVNERGQRKDAQMPHPSRSRVAATNAQTTASTIRK